MGVGHLSNRGFVLNGGYITSDVVTADFDSTVSYSVNNLVMYDNKLYKCITAHSAGAWDSTHFILTDIVSEMGTGSSNINATIIADTFNSTINYAIGDYVTYNNQLYKCTTAHSAGAWNSSNFTLTNVVSEMGTNGDYIESDVVTNEFDSTANYETGDYVMYNNQLYKCTTAHTGAWDSNDFEISTVLDCIQSGGGYGIQIIDEPKAEDIANSISTIWND